jgi:hypothetical protein
LTKERERGVSEVKADKHGKMPVEEAVGLLAIHCIAQHQLPRGFDMMVAAGQGLFGGIAKRATDLSKPVRLPICPGFR